MMRKAEAMVRSVTMSLLVLVVSLAASARAASPPRTLTLAVDASEAPRGILHARLTVPASPGPLTLVYPKWLPGEHGPTGPVIDLVGLTLSAAGRPVPWFRDTLDMYTFHCTVPAGAQAVEARYDFLLPAGGNFSSGVSSTQQLALISWNQVVLYPRGLASDGVEVAASLRLPDGWRFGTALPVQSEGMGGVRFVTT
ncbi:MAG: M61 family peptidase, partial [Candidatus Eisenbacteria bacterium]